MITPDLSSGCLAGITRELVLEIATVEERNVSASEIRETTEAFLTSSTRDISPISNLGDIELPNVPGEITLEVSDKFSELVASNPDP